MAFAIASLLLVAVLRILVMGLGGEARAEAFTRATILAESTLDAIGVVKPLVDGEAAEFDDGSFHVRATVDRYQGQGVAAGDAQYLVVYELAATVSWRDAGREQSLALRTLRLGPQR